MKISLNWLKEFIDLSGISDEEIVNRLTLSTAEIEGVEHKGKDLSGVVVAKIISCEPHPNSQKLHLLKVDNGKEILDIVCGAPNARVGLTTALANIGAHINGMTIAKAKVGGYDSYGMCCSGKEIGISDNNDGIMELDESLPLGTDFKSIFDIEDTIIEIDNKSLSNRPDLWGHYGFARELSAIFNRELREIEVDDLKVYQSLPEIKINISSPDCLRYTCIRVGKIAQNVSPLNMQIRLYYCGMRSISLLADLTNYIMLELGQPMHAFDGDKVHGINVSNAISGEKFTTLDSKERSLNAEALMIKDENNVNICVAGVMGGLDSEVTPQTHTLLLESATFSAVCIRKTANYLGLRSEASNRYEKSLDPELCSVATSRFLYLLKSIDNQVEILSSFSDNYAYHYPEIKIDITTKYIEDYCGIKLKENTVEETLKVLKFKVENLGDKLLVTVPSFRATKDVSIKADLVEEVSRIYGYDNIIVSPLNSMITPASQEFEHELEYNSKFTLANSGLNEVSTYIWENKSLNEKLDIATTCHLKVVNSLIKENDELRSELIPSLLEVVVNNLKYGKEIGVFEIARVIEGLKDNLAVESKHLGIVIASENKDEEEIYFKVKNCLEKIMSVYLNRELEYNQGKIDKNFVHPINNAIISCDGVELGYIGLLHPRTIKNIDKKLKIAVLEIDFRKLSSLNKRDIAGKQSSKYQATTMDFNFVVDKDIPYQHIKHILSQFDFEGLEYSFELKDIFENSLILGNNISYTFTFTISCLNHNLSGEELENFHTGLIEFGAKNNLKLREN